MVRKIKNIICFTGIWIPPAMTAVYWYIRHGLDAAYRLTWANLKNLLLFSAILMILNIIINSLTFEHGKRDYGLFDAAFVRTDRYAYPDREQEIRYPPVAPELLYDKPQGIVLGSHHGRYACIAHGSGGSHNTLIIGETGCGKTSTIVLDSILSARDVSVCAVDVKGELHRKGTRQGDERIIVIDPDDQTAWGYDPFYMLPDGYDAQSLMDAVNTIAFSLIPVNAAAKNPFWESSARDMLTACTLFFYRAGKRSFIDITDCITSAPIEDIIDLICEESAENMPEHKLIIRFRGMATETLSGINGQMQTALSLFLTNGNVRYMLRDNDRKASPIMLNDGKSIYISIAEHKLADYAHLLHLMLNQTITEMERRDESKANIPVMFIIDELARILSVGRIMKLENSLETLRSKRCSMMLISQSTSALQRAYTKAEVDGMIQNCPYKAILSASDKDTVESVIRWAGKARIRRYSYGRSGYSKSSNASYTEAPIVESSELISLPMKGKLIVTTPYGTYKLDKVPYYKDRHLKKLSDAIQRGGAERK